MEKQEMLDALEALKEEMGKEAFDTLSKAEKLEIVEKMQEAKVAVEQLIPKYVTELKGSEDHKNASDEDINKIAQEKAVAEVTEAINEKVAVDEYMYNLGMAQGAGFAAGFKAAMGVEDETEKKVEEKVEEKKEEKK